MTSAKPLSQTWQKLLRLIPGYDPIATAGKCVFDTKEAKRRLDFSPDYLKHVKGEKGGSPLILEPWERALIANIFGWKRLDGTRRYREVFLFVPRKNAKTTIGAGLVNSVMFQDEEPGMECYSAAADRDQASLVFSQVEGMILQDPTLSSHCQIYKTARSVVRQDRASSYKVISADAASKHGFNSHLIIIDELHAQPNRDLVDVLMTSTGARRQPLIVYLTTSDFERPSICNEKYDYACKVRDGIIDDPSFLPIIYEAPKEWEGEVCDYTNPKFYANKAIWKHANPNLGVSISYEYMERECKRAQETPSYLNTFLRLHLNVKTQQDVAWLDMTAWDGCVNTAVTPEALLGRQCWGGLDIGATSDLTSLCLLFPEDDGIYKALWWNWVPEDTLRKKERQGDIVYLDAWQRGELRTTPGNETDYQSILEEIHALGDRYGIQEIALDRLFQGAQLGQGLGQAGFEVIPFGMGFYSMAAPTQELERLVNRGDFRHGDNHLVRWTASNVMVETDAAGNMKPSKRKSTQKIDPIVAALMALGRAMVREPETGSVYEQEGILVL